MKSIKYMLLSFLVAGAFAACTKDGNYEPAAPESGNGVYFPNTFANTVNVTDDATSFDVPVLRTVTDSELTVALLVGEQNVFTVPTSVTFAEGATSATITIGYDPATLEFDEPYPLEITIDDPDNTTVYGASNVKLSVVKAAPWISLGMALFTEDFVTTIFAVNNTPYEVEIQENSLKPGYYRLVNPFGEAYPYNDPGDWDESKDYYMEIHAEDPDAVWIPVAPMGFDWSYGEFSMGSLAGYYISNGYYTVEELKAAGGYLGTLKDGVITFPEKMLLVSMANYNDGALYYANNNGAFRVVLPGVELSDYSVEAELTGYLKDLEDNNYAVVNVTLGADVDYALAASAEGDDYESLLNALLDEEIEGTKITASGKVELPIVDGKSCVVVVTFDANGEAQDYDYITFKFYSGIAPEPGPLDKQYSFSDFSPITDKNDLFKTWIMYAVDLYGDTDEREAQNYVTFSDSDITDEYDSDYINVSGIGLYFNDAILWEYYNGYIFSCPDNETHTYGSYKLKLFAYSSEEDGLYYTDYWDMIGAYVSEGYIAMIPYDDSGIDGLCVGILEDDGSFGGRVAAIYYNIMFEDSAVQTTATMAAKSSNVSVGQLKALANNMAAPANYVELRGRERAHALIDELNSKKSIKSATKRVAVADEMPAAHQVKATVTYSQRAAFDKQGAKYSLKDTAVSFR